MSTLYDIPTYVGTTDEPYPAPVLDGSAGAVEFLSKNQEAITTLGPVDPSIPASRSAMLFAGFFGDYFDKVYVIYNPLSLVNPIIGYPNKFYFWNTNFGTVSVTSYDHVSDLGLTVNISLPVTLPPISITNESITVGLTAPSIETALYTFHISDGSVALWTVFILEAIIQLLSPETPVIEVLKWKTVVDAARDGTEQRATISSFVRIEHNVNFLYMDSDEQLTVFEQLLSQANQNISYPIWTEQTRLLSNGSIGDTTIQIDTSRFDLKQGDQIILTEGHVGSETAGISTISGTTVGLTSGLRNNWDGTSPVYRVTTAFMQDKPILEREPYNLLKLKATMRFTEYRDLFIGTAAAQEIIRTTTLGDRVQTATVYTLDGIPILHARPIITDAIKEQYDWSFEIIDYDFGPFEFITDRPIAAVTLDRKYMSRTLLQKFYWNFVLNWCAGRRRPVWLPTWLNEIGPGIFSLTGSSVVMTNSKYSDMYPNNNAFHGLWIAYNGGWIARKITSISINGHGQTVFDFDTAVPDDFPSEGPWEVGFMILARQATDEVQREWNPAYNMLSTSFVSTKTSPEIT